MVCERTDSWREGYRDFFRMRSCPYESHTKDHFEWYCGNFLAADGGTYSDCSKVCLQLIAIRAFYR